MARKDHPKVTPVVVRWVDSIGTSGWRSDYDSRLECTSVGHLVEKNKQGVVICLNKSHYTCGDYIEIPRSSIKSIKKLKE